MVIILCGVAGSGKSTIGKTLSEKLNYPFHEGDDYHSAENITKMKQGIPLSDADRFEWLTSLNQKISIWNKQGNAILACSALKKNYRMILARGNQVIYIFLMGEKTLIKKRISKRKGHFFPIELLQSQFYILEVPTCGIHVSIENSVENITDQILEALINYS